jgi:hypothetical protein
MSNPRLVATLLATLLTATSACAADVDPYVPDDARLVAHVNLRQLLDAPLMQKHALAELHAALQEHAHIAGALQAAGLDPFRDLEGITLAGLPGKQAFDGLAIVRGRFDTTRVRAAAERFARERPDELTIHPQDGLTVYKVVSHGATERTVFAVLLDSRVLVLSPNRETVIAAARRDGKRTPALTKDLGALVAKMDDRQTAWLAAVITEDVRAELARSLLGREKAGHVKSVTGTFEVTEDILAEFHIHTTSPHTASDLRKMLEGVKALTAFALANNQKLAGQGPLLSEVVRSVKISANGGTVTGRAKIAASQIERGFRKGQKP